MAVLQDIGSVRAAPPLTKTAGCSTLKVVDGVMTRQLVLGVPKEAWAQVLRGEPAPVAMVIVMGSSAQTARSTPTFMAGMQSGLAIAMAQA